MSTNELVGPQTYHAHLARDAIQKRKNF